VLFRKLIALYFENHGKKVNNGKDRTATEGDITTVATQFRY